MKQARSKITTAFLAAILALLCSALPTLAGSATWLTNSVNSNWNDPVNWTAGGPPNGSADTATFGSSANKFVSLSTNTEVHTIVFSGFSTFSISDDHGFGAIIIGCDRNNLYFAARRAPLRRT